MGVPVLGDDKVHDRFSLIGKTVFMTGAAFGLGRAMAQGMAEAGARVACVDRDAEPLAETVELIGSQQTIAIVADLAVEDDVDRAVAEFRAWGGAPDILVNNAGIATPPARFHEVSVADWDRGIAVNLRSMFLCTRALLPDMIARRAGSIINLSSFLGLVGAYPNFAITAVPYAASKAGVVGLSRQVAIEYASDGIRCNVIAPGWHGGTNLGRERRGVVTPEQQAQFEAFITGSVPMGHRGTPDDLVGLALYLASDASRYLTGQVIAHDGGLTAA